MFGICLLGREDRVPAVLPNDGLGRPSAHPLVTPGRRLSSIYNK